MSELFKKVKENVSISAVIGNYIELKKSGQGYVGLCPFHGEKTPSFHVDEGKGYYYCFGCKASGDAVKFIEEYEKLSPVDAAKFLADKYGVDITDEFRSSYQKKQSNVLEILNAAAVVYTKFFWQSEEAKQYATKRGIPQQVVMSFRIGYAPRDGHSLYDILSKQYSAKELVQAGVVSEKGGRYFDTYRGRLMFPILDQRERVLGFGGRSMGKEQPKYINSSESKHFQKSKILYGLNIAKHAVKDKGYLLVTEGYMDVVSLYTAGVSNAVATLGTSMTEQHAELLSQYVNHVVICYDSDSAGIASAVRAVDILMVHIETVRVCVLGESLDPDEYIQKYGKESFDSKVEDAKLGVDFKIDQLALRFNLNDPSENNRFLRQAVAMIQKVRDPLDRGMYADNLAARYRADREIIREMVRVKANSARRQPKRGQPMPAPAIEQRDALSIDELLLKHFAMHSAEYIKQPELLEKVLNYPFSDENSELFLALVGYFEEHEDMELATFASAFGMDFARRLETIFDSPQKVEGVEILLHNKELECLKEELKIATKNSDMEKIQELGVSIKLKIKEINSLMLKGW